VTAVIGTYHREVNGVVPVSDEYANGVTRPAGFVRASRLYRPERRDSVPWDWAKMQPVSESQAAVEQAVADVLDERQR